MLIKDLIFIEEGNEDHLLSDKTHINIEKMLMIGTVLARIQYIQKLPYPFPPQEKLHQYFPLATILPIKERLELSKKLEPP